MRGKPIDLTGQRFGKLIIIERSYPNDKKGKVNWLCKCSCGKEKIIRGNSLKSGNTKSCGCMHSYGNRLTPELASMRALIGLYRSNAKRDGHDFELTNERFFELTKKDCYYCGAKPDNITKYPSHNGSYTFNGIDRIDNKKGYTVENTVPCCKRCNYAKKNLTLQEYKDWIENSYNKMFGEEK